MSLRDPHVASQNPSPRVDVPSAPVPVSAGRDAVGELSRRERDVLRLIARGLNNVEVAESLYLGVNSVKTYIRSAYRRIGVTTRSQAIVWAITHGLAPDVVRRAVAHGPADDPGEGADPLPS